MSEQEIIAFYLVFQAGVNMIFACLYAAKLSGIWPFN